MHDEEEALRRASQFAANQNYTGADPYDGLLSPFARLLFSRRLRQTWVQVNKRGGYLSRSAAQVPPVRMAKSLALFAQGHAILSNLTTANRLVDDLLESASGGPWGYEFDVQTRWAHYRRGTPNVVATTFALRALEATGRIPEASPDVQTWLESLWDSRGYFRYTAASDSLIHNGNLLAAESLFRIRGSYPLVEQAVRTTLRAQNTDGSLPYGSDKTLSWKDSFHTVYVIDSLQYLNGKGIEVAGEIDRALEYWFDTFFTAEGLPKYFSESRVPSNDIHNIATSLGALAKYAKKSEHEKLISSTKEHLLQYQGVDGAFRKQVGHPVFMRWDQGHAFLALCELAKRQDGAFYA